MDAIEHAAQLLRNGQLVAIPTETVYGLGADAKNPSAVQKIYAAKGRPAHNPLIIHIANADAMAAFAVDIPEEAWQLAHVFWPGPLTLILKKHPSVPTVTTAGQSTVALRVPNHPLTLQLLTQFKGGIAAPSANRSGRISPTSAEHVLEELGSQVDYILDGGASRIGIESTIVYLADTPQNAPRILRQGSIPASALTSALGKTVHFQPHSPDTPSMMVPGTSLSHYAPEKPLYLLTQEVLWNILKENRPGDMQCDILAFSIPEQSLQSTHTHPSSRMHQWTKASLNPSEYGQELYSHLRRLDKTASNCILVECPPATEPWLAIIDRLTRAARPLN